MTKLKEQWYQLSNQYSIDPQIAEDYWQEISSHYSGKGRYYHNLHHLEFMTGHFMKNRDKLKDPDAVLFAIFYHDIIYKTGRSDNEAKSADVAEERLKAAGINGYLIQKTKALIMATKNHEHDTDEDINFLVDFDLAILGENPAAYERYTQQVRKEYRIYPDILYKPGRKKVILHFLGMEHIYKTSVYRENCEGQARLNLETELKKY